MPIIPGAILSTLSFSTTLGGTANVAFCHVSGTVYATAFSDTNSGAGYIWTVNIASDGTLTSIASWNYRVNNSFYTSEITKIAAGVYLVIDSTNNPTLVSRATTVVINDDGTIPETTLSGPITIGGNNNPPGPTWSVPASNTLNISGDVYAVWVSEYYTPDGSDVTKNGQRCVTLSVAGDGTITIIFTSSVIQPLSNVPRTGDFSLVSGSIYAHVVGSTVTLIPRVDTVNITALGIVSAVDTLNLDTSSSATNLRLCDLGSGNWACFYSTPNNAHQRVKTFPISGAGAFGLVISSVDFDVDSGPYGGAFMADAVTVVAAYSEYTFGGNIGVFPVSSGSISTPTLYHRALGNYYPESIGAVFTQLGVNDIYASGTRYASGALTLSTIKISEIDLPTVTASAAPSSTSAVLGGVLTDDGGAVCACGFNWGLTNAYGHTTSPTQNLNTGGLLTKTITGLSPLTTYHYRSFATNAAGTGHSPDATFNTMGTPTVSSVTATVKWNSATLVSTLTNDGGEVCACGFQWGRFSYDHTTPTQNLNTGGSINQKITNLQPNKTYRCKAFATNSIGTGHSPNHFFTTLPKISRIPLHPTQPKQPTKFNLGAGL